MTGVRWREEGWEGRCDVCQEYWPLTHECWLPQHGMRRCRACVKAYAVARRRRSLAGRRERDRAYYRVNRARKLATQARYYTANRETILERARQRHAERRAATFSTPSTP